MQTILQGMSVSHYRIAVVPVVVVVVPVFSARADKDKKRFLLPGSQTTCTSLLLGVLNGNANECGVSHNGHVWGGFDKNDMYLTQKDDEKES